MIGRILAVDSVDVRGLEKNRLEKIRADLKKLATMTKAIRLYSSTGGVELVPAIAAEFGLKVTVGAWIDKNDDPGRIHG